MDNKYNHVFYRVDARNDIFKKVDTKTNPERIAKKPSGLAFIVQDALQGRREFQPGAGAVQVCTGHKIEYRDGQKVYVPQFVTQTF